MLKELRSEETYEKGLEKIVKKLEKAGFEDIRVDLDGYEKPSTLTNQSDKTTFLPDVTAEKGGRKHYFEIAKKTKDRTRLAGKWKLLATLAEMKNGALKIFAPYGQMAFTKRMLDQFRINCEVVSLPK